MENLIDVSKYSQCLKRALLMAPPPPLYLPKLSVKDIATTTTVEVVAKGVQVDKFSNRKIILTVLFLSVAAAGSFVVYKSLQPKKSNKDPKLSTTKEAENETQNSETVLPIAPDSKLSNEVFFT